MNNDQTKADVYEIVTTRIIEQIENNKIIPWRKPWTDAGIPRNLITKNAYRGINLWLLASAGFEQNFFLTWQQVQDLNAKVKRGEKAQLVVFWKAAQKESIADEAKDQADNAGAEGTASTAEVSETSSNGTESPAPRQKSILRYYVVFNIAQCENLPEHVLPKAIERPTAPIKACDNILNEMPLLPVIQYKDAAAWYNVTTDIINMPKRKSFESSESFYSVLFHELIHSTGHFSRLHRKELVAKTVFGSPNYSLEELCAEIGACFLKSFTGISDATFENSVAYIDGWLAQLKRNKKLIFYASSNAQKAVDFILDKKEEEKEAEVPAETELQTESI